MEAVFGAMGQAIPERLSAAPAGTSGNFGLGGYDPEENRHYIMYLFSGGGYGGWFTFSGKDRGELAFLTVGADLDVRYGSRDGAACAEFSWEGKQKRRPCRRGHASKGTDFLVYQVFVRSDGLRR